MEQLDEIEDSLKVGKEWKNDVRVILFVKILPGFELTEAVKKKIRDTIRVPALYQFAIETMLSLTP